MDEHKNVLWATFFRRRLRFDKSQTNQSFDIKENNWQEPVIESFTNSDLPDDVKQRFSHFRLYQLYSRI